MLSFAEKRNIQKTILEQNKILASNLSFTEKRQAQRAKADAMAKLGLIKAAKRDQNAVINPVRSSTAQLYEFDPNRKPAQRKKDNSAAMDLLRKIDSGEIDASSLTDEQKATLAKYSGTGGALIGADGKKGSAYEYYTPKPIASGAWDLLVELGFNGGKVLDPSAGVGIFGATAPLTAAIDSIELNDTSGRINGLVNSGAGYSSTISPFERVAASTPDEVYDAVITNVPFGGVADRGGNQLLDGRYQREPLQNYFILRSLEKLKPNGLAVFITPPRCVTGKGGKEEELRINASYMAEFLGAYRLPNSVFGAASADTMTDVIAFRKFGREMLDKIGELREQSPDTLIAANVQWQTFIEGHYFDREGKRFILGEFVPKNPNKFRDVDRVVNPASISEIAAMLRKFPDSRIDWKLLGASETSPIIYRDGDTITQSGQTLKMQDGQWVQLEQNEQNADMASMASKLTSPYAAFENHIGWTDANAFIDYMTATSQALDIPGWVRDTVSALKNIADDGDLATYWNAGVVGLSVGQVLKERLGREIGVKYIDEYPALSDAMQRLSMVAKKRPAALGGKVREALQLIVTHYQKKTGFSALWRGDVQTSVAVMDMSADSSFEGLRYKTKSKWVSLDDARGIFGDDFNPIDDSDWCISADGKQVTKADDYFTGGYADFLNRINTEIASATDDGVRAKLLRQKLDAENRIDRIDVSQLTFNLFSPLITLEDKAEFLRRFVHPSAVVVYDEKLGKPRVDIDIKGSNLTDREKLINRIGDYMKNGTITLGGLSLSMSNEKALQELRRMVTTANEQFDSWTRGNKKILESLDKRASDPAKIRFRQTEDETPFQIPGLHPSVSPHGYQFAFARRMGNEFGGGNAFDVGLGKTLSALISVQYVQSIGVKKKTFFVVPNNSLSNWRKESVLGNGSPGESGYKPPVYASGDDCLFVGLRTKSDGSFVIDTSAYDADLTSVLENRHSKIFMTIEAFARIRMRDETIADFEMYLRSVDSSFAESEDKKEDERAKSKRAGLLDILSGGSGGAPYLEDMGGDSLVSDESHLFKNSSQTSNFKGAKFLSLAPASARGMDMQAKAWYLRSKSPLKDGVLTLTATPITNSPLEIYSMMALASGHDRVNNMCLGIQGADEFMEMMCAKENIDDVTIDGVSRTTDVFVGLKNVNVLRNALLSTYTIKNAESVGGQIVVPDSEEKPTSITLSKEITGRLIKYKSAFRYAVDALSGKRGIQNRGSEENFNEVSDHFGEGIDLIGHPFNLINKMTLLIADPDLDERATFYIFPAIQSEKAKLAVDQFNQKGFIEERQRMSPLTSPEAIVGRKAIKDTDGQISDIMKIKVLAKIDGDKIVIDSMESTIQSNFEAIADKNGVDLDVSVPPKLAAMLENFQKEQANPRGIDDDGNKSPIVKQLIFCDILALHNKIKRLLVKRAGISASQIAIVTGKTNSKPDEILAVQDGFNANAENNKYRVIIANEKAEVAINLQKGTQAIHHLTIGYTPDSLRQRNGRGVRQGNKTKFVNVYHYDADGTFDTNKRTMVNHKAGWIDDLVDPNGANSVAVTGGLSREQMEALIDVVGDSDAMKRMQDTIAAKEAESRAKTNRDKQMINIDTVSKQRHFIDSNKTPVDFIIRKIIGLFKIKTQINLTNLRIGNPNATESSVAKNEQILAELEAKYDGLKQQIESSANIYTSSNVASSVENFFGSAIDRKNTREDQMEDMLRGKRYPNYRIEPIDGGPIAIDWQLEVEMAQSMIEESRKNFIRQSQEKGGYPADVIKSIADGDGKVFFEKPVVTGAFVRSQDGSLAIIDAQKEKAFSVGETGVAARLGFIETIKGASEIIYPGSSNYDECLNEAAAIEDKFSEKNEIVSVFSDLAHEVAQRRKSDILVEYDRQSYKLPHPFFPYVIDDFDTGGKSSVVARSISASQSSVVRRSSYRNFVVSSSVLVEKTDHSKFSRYVKEAMISYAKANSLKMVLSDFGSPYFVANQIEIDVSSESFRAALVGDSEQEIRDNARTFLVNSVTWFNYENNDPLDLAFLPYKFRTSLTEAINAKKIVEDKQKPESSEPSKPESSGDDEWVAMKSEYGFTKVVNVRTFASEMGEKAAWIGQKGIKSYDKEIAKNRPDAPLNTWVIKRKVFDALVEKYGDDVKKHSVMIVD